MGNAFRRRVFILFRADADAVLVSRCNARACTIKPSSRQLCRKVDAFFDASFVRRPDTSGRNATEE